MYPTPSSKLSMHRCVEQKSALLGALELADELSAATNESWTLA
jgi:hypothetical protein